MRTLLFPLIVIAVAAVLWWLLAPGAEPGVVLYCGVDQDQSQPIAKSFEEETGISVRYEGEIESQRSIGLSPKIAQERDNPRGDVFWANEIMSMVDLGQRGLLAPLPEGVAERFPTRWRDPAGHYVAFGARARIFLVNTALLPNPEDHPKSLGDLLDPKYGEMGLVTCMARPLSGTTYTHAVALLTRDEEAGKVLLTALAEAGAAGRMKITTSNGSAMNQTKDPANKVAFCLTDTDDAWKAVQEGAPVTVVYPDQAEGEMGTVLIPNTVAVIRGAPHPEAAAKLLSWLATPELELRLAHGPSAQIPLSLDLGDAVLPEHVKRPGEGFRAAEIDWQKVGENRDRWQDWLVSTFR